MHYSLAYQALSGEDLKRHQVSGIGADVTSFVLEDLEKWTEYLVWVRANTDVGPSPESTPARIRTNEDGMLMVFGISGLFTNTNPLILPVDSSSFLFQLPSACLFSWYNDMSVLP